MGGRRQNIEKRGGADFGKERTEGRAKGRRKDEECHLKFEECHIRNEGGRQRQEWVGRNKDQRGGRSGGVRKGRRANTCKGWHKQDSAVPLGRKRRSTTQRKGVMNGEVPSDQRGDHRRGANRVKGHRAIKFRAIRAEYSLGAT